MNFKNLLCDLWDFNLCKDFNLCNAWDFNLYNMIFS